MLTIRLDDVLSSSRTAHHKSAVVGLNKHILLPGALDVIYYLADWTPLSRP
jgi:hypothetical protein